VSQISAQRFHVDSVEKSENENMTLTLFVYSHHTFERFVAVWCKYRPVGWM